MTVYLEPFFFRVKTISKYNVYQLITTNKKDSLKDYRFYQTLIPKVEPVLIHDLLVRELDETSKYTTSLPYSICQRKKRKSLLRPRGRKERVVDLPQ